MNSKIGTLSLIACLTSLLYAQSGSPNISIESVLRWNTMELVSTVKLDLTSAGLKLPTGRARAEELLDIEFPRIVSPYLFSIPVDSSTTIERAIQLGQLSMLDMDSVVGSAQRTPAVLDLAQNSLMRNITVPLTDLSALLVRHQKPAPVPRPLIPQDAKNYTGIVIFAQEILSIYGRPGTARLVPCLFPKIWDTAGTLVYERNMVDPEIAKAKGIVRYTSADQVLQKTPSGIAPAFQELIGERPLRILADKVFGKLPTDPVISKDDVMVLLSSDHNRRLLTEGRVLIVIAPEVLVQNVANPAP